MLKTGKMKSLAMCLVAMAAATSRGQVVGPEIKSGPEDVGMDGVEAVEGVGGFPADMPPMAFIPPAPMPEFDGIPGWDPNAPSGVTVHDAETGRTFVLPARFGLQPEGEGGMAFAGVDQASAAFQDRSFGTMTQTNESLYPARVNCKVAMRFTNNVGGTEWYVCSGTMIDAETLLIAAHCVYNRNANIMDWAEEVFVFPGWDGNGDETPSSANAGIFNHYGYGRGTSYIAGSNYVNSGDWDADMANVRLTRAVGMLTGWHGYAWGQSCGTVQSRTYFNYSFPSEGCGTSGLHTGEDMLYWDGDIDECPDNQLRLNTTQGCYTAVWGGMSGSSMYYINNGTRYAHAVCSTSNRSTRGSYCKMWEAYKNDMVDFINVSRGSTFDLQALDCNFGPTSIPAGETTTTANFLAVNATNANPGSATYTYRMYLSTNSDVSSGDVLLATRTFTWDFDAMGSVRVNTGNVTIPESTVPGTYYLGVILDTGTDSVPSNNDTDEWDAQRITVTTAIPNNDACSPGFNLPLGTTLSGTNAAATADGVSNCGTAGTQRDVWYRFTAPNTARYKIETLTGGTMNDTVISVHSACPGTAANTVACDDDGGAGLLSLVTFDGTAGTTYRVRVAGYNGAVGTFNVRADYAPPANDVCGSAETISLSTGSLIGNNLGATSDGDTNCGGSSATTGADVWYAFTPTCTNLYTIDTEGTTDLIDTVLSIHSGCPATPGNTIRCDDDGGTGLLSLIETTLNAGTTYYVRVTGYAGTQGEFQLNVSAPGYSDECSRTVTVQSNTPTPFSTCEATPSTPTTEAGCRFTNNAVGADVWFRWVANCTGRATASVCGASYDSQMVVYNSRCPGTAGSMRMGCSDDACGDDARVSWDVTEGSSYYIRIGGGSSILGSFRGSGNLVVTCATPCPWQIDGCFADYNDDTGIDSDDVIAFFNDWEVSALCADVDGSGGVDGDDIIAMFGLWDRGGAGQPGC